MEYTDLRDWIARAEEIGELRTVAGASWESDIGDISEMLIHTLGAPTVLFDDIPGYPTGQRILVNANATRSRLAPWMFCVRPIGVQFTNTFVCGGSAMSRQRKTSPRDFSPRCWDANC